MRFLDFYDFARNVFCPYSLHRHVVEASLTDCFFTVCAKRHRDGDFVCVGGFDVCGISRPVFRNLDARRNNSCAVFGDFDTAALIRVVRADFKAVVSYARGYLINAVFPDGDALIKSDVVADGAAVVQNEISVVVVIDLFNGRAVFAVVDGFRDIPTA